MRKRILFLIVFSLLIISNFSYGEKKRPEIIIAAAADLQNAFEEIKPFFEKENSCKLILNFGSTGLLTHQIKQGAPYDILAAANIAYIEQIEKDNLIIPGTKKIYARGRITLWQRKNSKLPVNRLDNLLNPAIKRIAIANPDHAPYGVAAKEALISANLWNTLNHKIIYAENVRQTKQYAETGNVDAAIIALSISQDTIGRYFLIDESLHRPLDQALAIMKNTKNPGLVKSFCDFLEQPTGRNIMKKYGFLIPDESKTDK